MHYSTVEAPVCAVFRETFGPLASLKPGADTASYFFCSAGALAAGIASNHIYDVQRAAFVIAEKDGVKTCAAQNPEWLYRHVPGEAVGLPWVKVFITGDRNGDGKADWQDAALVYRKTMPKPYGSEFVRAAVGDQIAMNFASGAQQPFLRILDNIRKCWLVTDGIGQQVLIKGFSSEGHDSANTDYSGHYNERAGGQRDLNVLLENAGKYNTRVGIHINASEVYPEARRYKPEILRRDANGNPINGWCWLDQAHLIDRAKDTESGELFAELDRMRRDLPRLDFLYVDTYWESGWPAWKIAHKINSLGLTLHTEGPNSFDPWCTWAHWRGQELRIMQFLWYSERDIFPNDAVLRAASHGGFMGWQGEGNLQNFINCAFARNLPVKFLQHFELLRWEPGKEAVFSGEVKVVKAGDAVTVTQNGRKVMTWTGGGANNRLFVPWDPTSEDKIYVWDEVATEQTWELPPSWEKRAEVYLYKLTDLGRTEEMKVPVVNGRVTLRAAKSTPYVLYPKQAPRQKPLPWGEGLPVKDPGFDSHGFTFWKRGPAGAPVDHIASENDRRGNTRLVISGNNGAAGEVSQEITGLEGGKTYAASVWVQVSGKRTSSVTVLPLGAKDAKAVSNYVTHTDVRHSAPNDPRTGTNYQRLKVLFDLPRGCTKALLTLKAENGAPSSAVEFDDVRVVGTRVSPEAAGHWFWEDFENVDQGYGPFTCCSGEHTHLSETNKPYTQDTIAGRFSLKSRDGGRVLRTLPCTIRLKPNTRYRLSVETLTDPAGKGRLTVESKGRTVLDKKFPAGRGAITGEFATGDDTESFISLFKDSGDMIVIDDLAIDEVGPAPAVAEPAKIDDKIPNRRILLEKTFTKPLSADWSVIASRNPGTKVEVANGVLAINAAANVSALGQRKLPEGATAIECRLSTDGDEGQTWGPGLCLLWPGGQAFRVNLRGPDGCFGVDSTVAAQIRTGILAASDSVSLRIRLEPDEIVGEARNAQDDEWQILATFPREKFPGDPATVRIGKMHGVEGAGDHSDPGPEGACAFHVMRIYGK